MIKNSDFDWLNAVKIGLIGGAVAILLCLVGMVTEFHGQYILRSTLSLGQTFLLIITLVIGYVAAARSNRSEPAYILISGTVAGLLTGGLLSALILLGRVLDLRNVFVNASPDLYEILTLGQEGGLAPFYVLGIGALLGLLAALIYLIPSQIRRAVLIGMAGVIGIGILQDLLRVTLSRWESLNVAVTWLLGPNSDKGLSLTGAFVVAAIFGVLNYLWAGWGNTVQGRINALPPAGQRAFRVSWLLLTLVLLLYLPNLLGSILSEAATTVGIYILMGLGLNIVVGFAGLLDLGYVAFFAIGAYTMSVLTTTGGELTFSFGLTFWEALPIAIGISVLAGVILGLPVLHVRGDYLAIVTLGFGEIIGRLAVSDFLKPYIGGSQGIVEVARGRIPAVQALCSGEGTGWPCQPIVFDRPQILYYLILAGCLLAAFIAIRLKDSRMGRTWMAMREDEDVAQAMGVDLVKTKLLAFGAGAAFSGLAGAIFASKLGSITPASFGLLVSINALALIIIGGMGSIPGVIVGALALVGLPELLREFSEFRLLVYGAVLMAMMLVRPEGLWPEESHRRELHEQDEPAPAEPEPGKEIAIAVE
jgi:branched-chain amino acid transport system permease protein